LRKQKLVYPKPSEAFPALAFVRAVEPGFLNHPLALPSATR
jgi:hypothetical protein